MPSDRRHRRFSLAPGDANENKTAQTAQAVRGFRQKKSLASKEGSAPTSGPRPSGGKKTDESSILGSIVVVMPTTDDIESSSVEGSPKPHEPEAPKHELRAQKSKPNETADPKPSLSARAATPSQRRPTPPQRGLTISTSRNASRSSSQDTETENIKTRDIDHRVVESPESTATAAARHRPAALEFLPQAMAVQPCSQIRSPVCAGRTDGENQAPNPLQVPKMGQPVDCGESRSQPASTALRFSSGASQRPAVAPTKLVKNTKMGLSEVHALTLISVRRETEREEIRREIET